MSGTSPARYPVVSVDCAASRSLLNELRAIGLPIGPVIAWGDAGGYSWLRRTAAGAVLLDLPRYGGGLDAGFQVTALSTLGSVLVLAPWPVGAVEVLGAGGRAYVDRGRPTTDIAGLVVAHLGRYWVGHAVPPALRVRVRQPYRFLIEWLLAQAGEFSCHHLRWLLGRAGRPLSLVDVRSKLRRIEPALRAQGTIIRQVSPMDNAGFVVQPMSPVETGVLVAAERLPVVRRCDAFA